MFIYLFYFVLQVGVQMYLSVVQCGVYLLEWFGYGDFGVGFFGYFDLQVEYCVGVGQLVVWLFVFGQVLFEQCKGFVQCLFDLVNISV